MNLITRNVRLFVVAAVVALVVGGTAYAATSLNGHTIKNGSIPLSKLTKQARSAALATVAGPQGATGAAGAKGATGAAGAKGATGAAGTNGVTGATGATGVTGTSGTNGTDGTNGTNGVTGPTGDVGPKGDVGPAGPTEHNYGVAGLFLDGSKVASVWTSTIPMDNNNAGMGSGTTIVTCTAAPCTLSLSGAVRSDNPQQFKGQAGAGLIVTNAATGQLVAAGQTAANPAFGGVKVVDPIETVPTNSGEPSFATGTAIPLEWAIGSDQLAAGTYIVQGTVEFFDFS